MKMYSRKELENLYDDNPNELFKILSNNTGLDENVNIDIFNSYPKDQLIDQIMNLVRYSQFDEQKESYYSIPKEYKKSEYKLLKKENLDAYNEMNNSINKVTGETLQALYEYDNDKYYIGIHRTSLQPEQVFKDGIKTRETDINDHVQLMKDFPFMLREIKNCEGYKFSSGCFIIKVPKPYVNGTKEEAKPIYYAKDNGLTYLRPEYIAAYVPVLNGQIGKIEMNDYSHNIYNENTEFLYDDNIIKEKTYGFINIFVISLIIIFIAILIILM